LLAYIDSRPGTVPTLELLGVSLNGDTWPYTVALVAHEEW